MKFAFLLAYLAVASSAFTLQIPATRCRPLLLRMAEESQTLEKVESIQTMDKPTPMDKPMVEEKAAGRDLANQWDEEDEKEDLSETKKLMQQVKDAGVAGVISYAAWEFGFWTISVPICIAGYREVTGHWPDFSNQDDLQKLGAEAFAFVNFARFAVPLRIGLALGTTPWIQENVVDRFLGKKDDDDEEMKTEAGGGLEC
mmetsp:Transcript_27720/g.40925  ORF Transcript_27720/g.40925 Transcript_27720/m.40925 type:complete len:200 (-) Transcript_27720:120-719(-)